MDAQVSFLDQLFVQGVLHDSGVEGLYARSGEFEDVISRFETFALSYGEDEISEAMVFPPGMTMKDFETSGYMKNFPQLAGTVHAFCGNDHDHVGLLQCMAADKDWNIRQQDGSPAHTACVGFGLERLALALFRHHGFETSRWPEGVKAAFWG